MMQLILTATDVLQDVKTVSRPCLLTGHDEPSPGAHESLLAKSWHQALFSGIHGFILCGVIYIYTVVYMCIYKCIYIYMVAPPPGPT